MARMTLDLTPELENRLADIASRSGITKAEAMRRAFALLSVADDEKRKGNTLAVVREGPNHEMIIAARLVGII